MKEVNGQHETAERPNIPTVDTLKQGETTKIVEKLDSNPFRIQTNTFPVELNNPNLRVLEYEIQFSSKVDEEKESPSPSSLKKKLKQQDLSKYLNKLSF